MGIFVVVYIFSQDQPERKYEAFNVEGGARHVVAMHSTIAKVPLKL